MVIKTNNHLKNDVKSYLRKKLAISTPSIYSAQVSQG
jgi:hypothetical protein